ncbi:MAG: hypothetical protein ACJAYI_001797 [Myxococcota bacterium]
MGDTRIVKLCSVSLVTDFLIEGHCGELRAEENAVGALSLRFGFKLAHQKPADTATSRGLLYGNALGFRVPVMIEQQSCGTYCAIDLIWLVLPRDKVHARVFKSVEFQCFIDTLFIDEYRAPNF